MSVDKYLTVLGACIGFLSAVFFAMGTLRMKNQDVKGIASTYWDFNQHLADSITSQRAEYVVGSFLLLLAFLLQLVVALLPEPIEVSFLQPLEFALFVIGLSFCAITLLAWLLARSISARTKSAVSKLLRPQIDEQNS